MAETIYEALDRIGEPKEVEVPADASPLDFLCAVYCDALQPMSRRMRAAIEAAPYVHPTYRATALALVGGDFAERLEGALERSGVARNGGSVVIDHSSAAPSVVDANSQRGQRR